MVKNKSSMASLRDGSTSNHLARQPSTSNMHAPSHLRYMVGSAMDEAELPVPHYRRGAFPPMLGLATESPEVMAIPEQRRAYGYPPVLPEAHNTRDPAEMDRWRDSRAPVESSDRSAGPGGYGRLGRDAVGGGEMSSMDAPFARWDGSQSKWIDPAPESLPRQSLFEKYKEALRSEQMMPKQSLITNALIREENVLKSPEAYTKPFCDFLTENPTVFHAVDYFEKKLEKAGFKKVCQPMCEEMIPS
jgi:hypothetical protein